MPRLIQPLVTAAVTAPERVTLSSAQYNLIFLAIVVTGFSLFAHFVYNWNSTGEVSSRYRPAVFASMCIAGVATLSYLVLLVKVDSGYDLIGGRFVPNAESWLSIAPRYMDWSVTVPLLMVELLAVCTLVGRTLSTTRAAAMTASVAMIVTGYLGTQVFSNGQSTFWLWLWWAIAMVCFVAIYAIVVPAVLTSAKSLPADAGRGLIQAATLLLSVFCVYPVVYLIPIFFDGGWWTTGMQVAYSAADVTAKVGFGMLIHKVAKLRTAADLAAGEDTHPEPVWLNSIHHSKGAQPVTAPVSSEVHTNGRTEVHTSGHTASTRAPSGGERPGDR